jgi:PAS domain S-box-containing protein
MCSLYETLEQRLAVAVAFIRAGLDRGEQCLYFTEGGPDSVVRDAMAAGGIDVEQALATRRVVLAAAETTYLKHGSFDPDWMFTFWAEAAAEAMRLGFSGLRALAEPDWVARNAVGLRQWIEYECRLTQQLAGQNSIVLCQYNRVSFSPALVLDIIRTHPTVIYRGVVCRNMYYVPPDEFLSAGQAAREVERLLAAIVERENVESTLLQQRSALLNSEERWRSVFENSAIGIVLADPGGHIVETNRAFQELLGYTNAEFKALTYKDISHPADIHAGEIAQQQLLSGSRREAQIEKRYRHKDGRVIWTRATGTVIAEGDGSPRFLLGLVEDVSDRKTAQRKLDASVRQLRALAGRLMHAQDDERRRIAQMLHETTAQDLAAMKMLLARVNRTAGDLSEGERVALAESISLAEQAMSEVRTLSYLLHPPFLDEAGLVSAVRWYVAGFTQRSGIKVELDLPDNFERLALDTETALFRIVQESLINIHRHAGSETAQIRLQRNGKAIVLEIEDRGRGIPRAALTNITSGGGSAGVGIPGMSERIEQLGGSLEITSHDHGPTGTAVRVRLPLGKDAG